LDARPDIVHAHWTYEYELAARDCRLPHVTTAHDAPFEILRHVRDPYRAARLLVALRARLGITDLSCVSPYLSGRWRSQMGYRRPIEVIPNVVPQDTRLVRRLPRAHPTVLDITDASELKNVKGLLRSFALVRQSIPDAELRLVGPGLAEGDDLAMWAGAAGLTSGVTFVGPTDRAGVAAELGGAWLLAHASREESFGVTVLEAVGSGLGALGSAKAGGVPYVLGDGAAGWLTDVDDPVVFARAMADLISDGPVAPPPGASLYLERFSRDSVTASYVSWYRRVLDDHALHSTAA
jgi:glycosyltransferase involved in cell wall biosynthesis